MVLAWYGMRIRELGIYLTEVQTTLKQIEALQQKAAENQNSSDAAEVFGEHGLVLLQISRRKICHFRIIGQRRQHIFRIEGACTGCG